ncbi:MAG: RNA polymerase sigma factor [Bacteroidales bacterium]|nr:RNA polymerase sigma factor [Bacteroidales bacterium]
MTRTEFNRCVDSFADGVYRFILKNIKDTDKAGDIVQDTFTKMWEKVHEISYEKAKSYLFTAAYHTMIDSIRKEKKVEAYHHQAERAGSVENAFSDVKEIINEALGKLPEIQRSVLMLRDYEGYSYAEIGEITGLNEPQVKVYIHRARVSMKNYLVSMDKLV